MVSRSTANLRKESEIGFPFKIRFLHNYDLQKNENYSCVFNELSASKVVRCMFIRSVSLTITLLGLIVSS
jgi:hypothetical protein